MIVLVIDYMKPNSELCNVDIIIGSEDRLQRLVQLYESYISEEWYQPWDTFTWVTSEL